MRNTSTGWLFACAALAAGEYTASQAPGFATAWPAVAVLAALTALFGYGLAVRGWHLLFLFALGAALFLGASVDSEMQYRLKPWLRTAGPRRRAAVSAAASKGSRAEAVRRELSRRSAMGLDRDREAAALNRAILLGDRRGLPRRVRRLFVESGTIHVFAISGLHVMAVAQLLYWLLRVVFVPRRLAGMASVPLLWTYVWVVGMPPSAVRAAMMATFYHAAPVFWRKPDGTRAWALSFLVVYLGDPTKIGDVGCGLSFAVMLSILLALDCGRSFGGAAAQTLWVTFAAWAGGVPIAAHVFGRVTPGGLAANLLLLPSAAVTVVSGALGLMASFVSEGLAAHLNNVSALFSRAMAGVSAAVARLPGANLETGCWPVWACLAWYAALLGVLYAARRFGGRRGRSMSLLAAEAPKR